MNDALRPHLSTLHDLLIRRLGELQAEIGAADIETARSYAEASLDGVRDTKDAAAQTAGAVLQSAQRQRDADEAALVEAALQRMDAGTYGDCADCGEPIAPARLLAHPAAVRCAGCQAGHEGPRLRR